jgi:hypothetical protein
MNTILNFALMYLIFIPKLLNVKSGNNFLIKNCNREKENLPTFLHHLPHKFKDKLSVCPYLWCILLGDKDF